MNAIERLTDLVLLAPSTHKPTNLRIVHDALIDTISCMFAGAREPVTENALRAMAPWGSGDAILIGRSETLSPPFAALVNAAAGHAHDYDDYDTAANSHPSVILFPALLALGQQHQSTLDRVFDAYIVGLEVLQRLGEAFGPAHYKRGWLATMTLGIFAVAGACCRLTGANRAEVSSALSLAVSMASGMTNQMGHTAKQLHPGITAKNGMMACALAQSGITGNAQTLDGPGGFARLTSDYDPARFDEALSKLARPWSIEEYCITTKVSPMCGYVQRIVEAAAALRLNVGDDLDSIEQVRISIPDYYMDILVHPKPTTAAEAMFSAEHSVAVTLIRGGCDFSALSEATLSDPQVVRLRDRCWVDHRKPLDSNVYYDPLDPDRVEVRFKNGSVLESECSIPLGSSKRPLGSEEMKQKFDDCIGHQLAKEARDQLWLFLVGLQETMSVSQFTHHLGVSSGR